MTVRVAHIIGGLGVGGAERNVVNLLNTLRCDYRMLICIRRRKGSGPTFDDLVEPAIERHAVPISRRTLPVGVVKLASLLKKKRINVVHTHMYHANFYGAVAARLAGVPVIVTSEHGENPWKGPFQRWVERRVISPIVAVRLCVSPRILEERRDVDGVPAAKLRLMVNGTRLPALRPPQRDQSGHVIGAVGRFIEAKDYPTLLEAAKLLRSRGFKLKVHILGDGPEAARVRESIVRLELGSIVNLPGMVKDTGSWYPKFDVFVSSSVREGLPMVLLEAMAHGLPIVATDVGACAQVVGHGEGGLIVPAGEPRQLADAIARLLENPELRNTLGQGARQRIEHNYSVDSVAAEHLRLYEQLLAMSGALR